MSGFDPYGNPGLVGLVLKGSKPPPGYKPMKHSQHGGYVSADGKKSWYPSKAHASEDHEHHTANRNDYEYMLGSEKRPKHRAEYEREHAKHDKASKLAEQFIQSGDGPSEVSTVYLKGKPDWEEAQRNPIDSKNVPKNLPVVNAAKMFSTDDLAGPAANYGPVWASGHSFSPEFAKKMKLSPMKNSQFIMNVTDGPNKGKYVISTEGYNYPRYMAKIKGS